jgi:DNA-binding CsgD family transcriptional regulator
MTLYARPFNLLLPDGTVLHGAEYPSGQVFAIPAGGDAGGAWVAISLDVLLNERMPANTIIIRPTPEPLTARQLRTLTYAADGHSNAWIAHVLGVSLHTVKNTLRESYLKLGVGDRVSAAAAAREAGLIPPARSAA